MNQIDLTHRCAVVTGGAQGFGRAIAERFVAPAPASRSGITTSLSPSARRRRSAPAVIAIEVDVTDLAAVEKPRATRRSRRSARSTSWSTMPASPESTRRWRTPTIDEWRKVLRINLDGPFLCCKAIVPLMIAHKLRPHRQHRLDRRQGRQPQRRALFGLQGRPDRADQIARQGTGRPRHRGQRGDAGGGAHRDLRADDASAHRLHAVENSERPLRAGRGTRGDGGVAGLRGLFVLDRRGVRHFRRPRDVLTARHSGARQRSWREPGISMLSEMAAKQCLRNSGFARMRAPE